LADCCPRAIPKTSAFHHWHLHCFSYEQCRGGPRRETESAFPVDAAMFEGGTHDLHQMWRIDGLGWLSGLAGKFSSYEITRTPLFELRQCRWSSDTTASDGAELSSPCNGRSASGEAASVRPCQPDRL